jgi:AraC family transcriptional regulator, arabinose operon regulatory protein
MTQRGASPPGPTQAYVWDGVLLFAPGHIVNTRHAHFAATLLISVDAPFALTLDGAGRRHFEAALLAPNVQRELDSEGHRLVDLLIDPDDPAYRHLHPLLAAQPVVPLPGAVFAAQRPRFARLFAGRLDCAAARQLVSELLQALCPAPLPALPWDTRVQQATRYMRARIPEALPTIPEVATQVGLSESRFMHLFRAQLGLPVRQYLLWLRMRHAMRLWAQGRSLAEIALGAGFYDQAHFARTVRRMTDYAPSMLTEPGVARHDCTGCG